MHVENPYRTCAVPQRGQGLIRRAMVGQLTASQTLASQAKATGYNYLGWLVTNGISARVDTFEATLPAGAFHVSGQITDQNIELRAEGPFLHIIFELRPSALFAITGTVGHMLIGESLNLFDIAPHLAAPLNQLNARISGREDELGAAELIDQFTSEVVSHALHAAPSVPHIDAFAELVEGVHGNISVLEASRALGISSRHLSRQFLRFAGVTPKAFISTVQLNAALTQLMKRQPEPISDVAFAAGFSDQSHLNKRLRKTYDCTPKQFVERAKGVLGTFVSRAS